MKISECECLSVPFGVRNICAVRCERQLDTSPVHAVFMDTYVELHAHVFEYFIDKQGRELARPTIC